MIVQKIDFKKGKGCTDGMSSKSKYSIKTKYWMEWHISCTSSDTSWLWLYIIAKWIFQKQVVNII